ncbi:hypothetical protein F4819DRAFT_463376, partial [Hypoxylon fuscum]
MRISVLLVCHLIKPAQCPYMIAYQHYGVLILTHKGTGATVSACLRVTLPTLLRIDKVSYRPESIRCRMLEPYIP